MELKLSEQEVKQIVLEWAQQTFKDRFDHVETESSYGAYQRGVILSKKSPVGEE